MSTQLLAIMIKNYARRKYAPGLVLILVSVVLPHLLEVMWVLLSVVSLFSHLFLLVSIAYLLCRCSLHMVLREHALCPKKKKNFRSDSCNIKKK